MINRSNPLTAGYLDIDNSNVYYEVLGSGPRLTLIHDGLIDCRVWEGQFQHFADQFQMIRYDRRGYGRSDPPQADYSNISDLYSLLSFLGIEETILMGCSGGGMVALDFTLAYPDKVTALILVGPAVSGFEFSDHIQARLKAGFKPLIEDDNVEQTIENWASDPQLIHPANPAAQEKFRELLLKSPHNFFAPRRHKAVEPGDPAIGRLAEVKAPTLIVIGEADDPDKHAAAGALQVGIHGSRRIVFSGGAHLPHLERPEIFNGLVGDFLVGQAIN